VSVLAAKVSAEQTGVSPPDVDDVRDRFEMGWVHAQSRPAQMVDFKSGPDRSDELLVGPPVRVVNSTIGVEGAVERSRSGRPEPAAVLGDHVLPVEPL
jgi:hypothetical protein